MRVLVAIVVWAAAVAAAAALSNVVADSVHTSASASAASGGASFDAGKLTADDTRSLFHTANVARALTIARSHIGATARVESVVIYPGYLSTTAVRPGGETDVYVDATGRYEPTTTNGNPGGTPLLSLAKVQAGAPAAIAHKIARLAHVPLAQLHYMIAEIDSSTHRFHWLIYTQPGSRAEYFETPGAGGPLFELRADSSTGLQRVRG